MGKTNTKDITQGEDKVLRLTIRDKNTGVAENFTGVTSIEATFCGTVADVVKTLGAGIAVTGDSPFQGKIEITLDEADTAALKEGKNQDFKLKYVIAGDTTIEKIKRRINVIDPSC